MEAFFVSVLRKLRLVLTPLPFVAVGVGFANAQTFTQVHEFFIRIDSPHPQGDVFFNSTVQDFHPPIEGAWQTEHVQELNIPTDVIAVFLSGILIVTHGRTNEIADMGIVFRRPGDATILCQAGYEVGQVVEADIQGGQRSTMSTWVPVVDGAFQWCWWSSTDGTYPDHPSYGANLTVQAYAR